MKKLLSVTLTLILFITMLAVPASAKGLNNFQRSRTYNGHFKDVSATAWYCDNIKTAYELDLVDGTAPDKFGVSGNVTIAQTITMAARMHKIYHEGNREFTASSPWYKSYVDYALQNGIIKKAYSNYGADISRSEFAAIFSRALPDEALREINLVQDNAIPDVPSTAANAAEIYKLYRSGILGGNDKSGKFTPNNPIRRSESTAIAARMSDEELRVDVVLVDGSNHTVSSLRINFVDMSRFTNGTKTAILEAEEAYNHNDSLELNNHLATAYTGIKLIKGFCFESLNDIRQDESLSVLLKPYEDLYALYVELERLITPANSKNVDSDYFPKVCLMLDEAKAIIQTIDSLLN